MTYLKPRVFLVLPNPARHSTGGFSVAAGEAVICQEVRHGQLVCVDTVDRKAKTLVSPDTAICVDDVDRMVKPWP